MKRSSSNKLAMYGVVKLFLANENENWKDISGFSANVERFNDLLNQIEEIRLTLRTSSQPTTAQKYSSLDELSKKAVFLQGVFRSWALEEKVEGFDALLKMNLTEIKYGAAKQRAINIRHLINMAQENLEKLSNFGWSAEQQEEITTLMEKASESMNAPTQKRQELKSLREKLDKIFGQIDEILKAMDMMVYGFSDNNADFATGWKNSRIIIDRRGPSRSESEEADAIIDAPDLQADFNTEEDPPSLDDTESDEDSVK